MVTRTDSLIRKLDEMEARYVEIEQALADPAVASNSHKLVALVKEQGKLKATVGRYRRYRQAQAGIADARGIVADPHTDEEFRGLAEAEIAELEDKSEALLQEMQDTLVMADDMHVDAIIMEIRAGTGGEEAALFARDLYEMYTRYAEHRHWKVEQLSFSASEKGGFREVIFAVKGPGVWSEMGYEGGGHRVQRVPETEAQGRIHTSAATVAVLPEPEELEIEIGPDDVVEQVEDARTVRTVWRRRAPYRVTVTHTLQAVRNPYSGRDDLLDMAWDIRNDDAVDLEIGLNLFSRGGAFSGTKIRALAEAAGMVLGSDGLFTRYDDSGRAQFSLQNYESTRFSADALRTLTTHGLTFLLDVPRVDHGERVFQQMSEIAKRFADTLQGALVDDNRQPLSESQLDHIRREFIGKPQATMASFGLAAGSPQALRLFS